MSEMQQTKVKPWLYFKVELREKKKKTPTVLPFFFQYNNAEKGVGRGADWRKVETSEVESGADDDDDDAPKRWEETLDVTEDR